MPPLTNCKKQEELYESHLKAIKNIRFTFREVDILSCIIHNRGEKKIAFLLSISPRTVSAHVYNMMSKIGCNSKEQIIDFIENSGKLSHIRQYYLHLLINSNFERLLGKIATLINKQEIIYYADLNAVMSTDQVLFKYLQQHFKMANINLMQSSANNITNFPELDLSKITADDYYQPLLQYIKVIVNKPQISDIVQEFTEISENIKHIQEGKPLLEAVTGRENELYGKELMNLIKKQPITYPILAFGLISILIAYIITYNNNNENISSGSVGSSNYNDNDSVDLAANTGDIVSRLAELLAIIDQTGFSADNVTPDKTHKNYSHAKAVEKFLSYASTDEVKRYLISAEIAADMFNAYLYNLHALANHYLHSKHDGMKAYKLLNYAKEVAENYITSRSNVGLDFSKLAPAEILTELNIIKDLPEIYTRIVYSLGRTYLYNNGEAEKSRRYFEIAKHIGRKLNLLEGYLSDRSGIYILDKKAITQEITEGKLAIAINKLERMIILYEQLKFDDNSYISDYKPGSKQLERVIPSQDNFNLAECTDRIIECYILLIKITDHQDTKIKYVKELTRKLSNNVNGLLSLINSIPPRKAASLYNNLGNLLFELYQSKTKSDNLKELMCDALLLKLTADDLTFIEQVFTEARTRSRSTDYTKADSYHGLILVYQAKLKDYPLNDEQRHFFQGKIGELTKKRDNINQALNRSFW